jgi:uncharacterized protein (TIGR02271 family)
MTSEPMMLEDDGRIVVPLHAEEISVAKQRAVTGRLQISLVTRQQENVVEELLAREHVEIERMPIDRLLEHAPAIREEGDTIIIPVVEEVLVMERRLLLKEEIRVRRVRETESHQERVKIRKQDAVIIRFRAEQQAAVEQAAVGFEQQIAGKEK